MKFIIDIVDACNIRCTSCIRGQLAMKNSNNRMEFSLFEKIMLKASHNGVDSIELYNWTEPFLHPDIEKFVSEVKKYDLPLSLSSNLSLKSTPQLIDTLKAGVDTLHISVSGFRNETHQINHIGSDINIVKKHLQEIAEKKSHFAHDCKIFVKYLEFDYNKDEIAEFEKFVSSIGLSFRVVPGFGDPEKGILVHSLGKENITISPNDLKNRCFINPCKLLFDSIPIDASGNVFLCCDEGNYEIYKIGNFLEMDFSEIMLRRLFHPQCRVCDKQDRTKNEKFNDFRRPLKNKDVSRITQWFDDIILNEVISNKPTFNYADPKQTQKIAIFPAELLAKEQTLKANIEETVLNNNSLNFNAINNDPILILPEIKLESNRSLIVYIDITVPSSTFIQLFYKTPNEENYNETNSIKLQLEQGRKKVYFNLNKIKISGRLRIDPGAIKGNYHIHNIEVSEILSN